MMFNRPPEALQLHIPPWPSYITSSYRQFEHGEMHVTRYIAEYVLLFMLQGTLYFTEEGEQVAVEEGQWYIQVPGLFQSGGKASPAPFYYYVHFQGEGAACSLSEPRHSMPASPGEAASLHFPVRGVFDAQLFRPLFDQLSAANGHTPQQLLERQAIFLSLLGQLARTAKGPEPAVRKLAESLLDYLSAHYQEPLSGETLERLFHYSYDYLTRLLKHHCGITPGQYIQHCRIRKAQELLEQTGLTLPAIAQEVGYGDPTVFYRAFRKHSGGMAPGQWRQAKRGLGQRGADRRD